MGHWGDVWEEEMHKIFSWTERKKMFEGRKMDSLVQNGEKN